MAANMQLDGGHLGRVLRVGIWFLAAALLAVPAIAMRFTTEVDWTATDFVAMGVLLFGACGLYEFGARLSGRRPYRAAVGVAVVAGLLLTWVNLAVGIIGAEDTPANLVYFGVPLVAIVGALVAKFRAEGMALALLATAVAQGATAAVALHFDGLDKGFVLSLCFIAPWLLAAFLFQVAAQADAK
jgi:hypothetical protein